MRALLFALWGRTCHHEEWGAIWGPQQTGESEGATGKSRAHGGSQELPEQHGGDWKGRQRFWNIVWVQASAPEGHRNSQRLWTKPPGPQEKERPAGGAIRLLAEGGPHQWELAGPSASQGAVVTASKWGWAQSWVLFQWLCFLPFLKPAIWGLWHSELRRWWGSWSNRGPTQGPHADKHRSHSSWPALCSGSNSGESLTQVGAVWRRTGAAEEAVSEQPAANAPETENGPWRGSTDSEAEGAAAIAAQETWSDCTPEVRSSPQHQQFQWGAEQRLILPLLYGGRRWAVCGCQQHQ